MNGHKLRLTQMSGESNIKQNFNKHEKVKFGNAKTYFR
jgi:hypothetical protein